MDRFPAEHSIRSAGNFICFCSERCSLHAPGGWGDGGGVPHGTSDWAHFSGQKPKCPVCLAPLWESWPPTSRLGDPQRPPGAPPQSSSAAAPLDGGGGAHLSSQSLQAQKNVPFRNGGTSNTLRKFSVQVFYPLSCKTAKFSISPALSSGARNKTLAAHPRDGGITSGSPMDRRPSLGPGTRNTLPEGGRSRPGLLQTWLKSKTPPEVGPPLPLLSFPSFID